jgi:hypothetical protein
MDLTRPVTWGGLRGSDFMTPAGEQTLIFVGYLASIHSPS